MKKKHKVILHPDAELDIEVSFKWGCRAWGEENAKLWVRKLRLTFQKQLTSMPLACPLAPEKRSTRCCHPAFDRRTLSRPLHG